MTNTPAAAAKTLSKEFLEKYIADPEKNPYGQFYTQAYSGSLQEELPKALERYGAITDPSALAQELLTTKTDGRSLREGIREMRDKTRADRAASYQEYKDAYGKAKELYRQQREAGFATPEAAEEARQGLAAVREATFSPYLARRAYLQTQARLQRDAGRIAKLKNRIEEKENRYKDGIRGSVENATKIDREKLRQAEERAGLRYGAVKDIGQGGAIDRGPESYHLGLGEAFQKMMNEAVWSPVAADWRKQNAPVEGYGYSSLSNQAATRMLG